MQIDKVKIVKDVRERTGVGLMEIRKALDEMDWNADAAVDLITTSKKTKPKREVGYSAVFHYNHNNRIAALVTLGCNTDFVGKMEAFKALGFDIAQQVVGTDPVSVEALLEQDFVKTPGIKIKDMLEELSRQTQEDITVMHFYREQT